VNAPAVTVLMPVRNGERFLKDAITSILAQTWTDFEFVIIDDGSTDATAEVIASFTDRRIRSITNGTSEGLPRALNRGLDEMHAPLVARHDGDDVAHPKRLETQLAFLRANPEVVLLGTQVRVLDTRGRTADPPGWRRALTQQGIRFQSMFDNPFMHSSVVFRRDIICGDLGGYDPAFASCEDFDLWSRVTARYAVRNLPQKLVGFRLHAASTAAHFGIDHIVRSSAVVNRNVRDVLQLEEVPERWSSLLASLHVDPRAREPIDGRELLDVLATIHDRYRQLYPEGNPEVRQLFAAKLGHIASVLASTDRRAALRAFSRAARVDVRAAAAFATRVAAHAVTGAR
jgi:glycosyltransferase involved in cell wall biosynthesis